jgi:hypothetical protein
VHFRGSFFLEKVSTLDLVAILGGVELLHELVVLHGNIRLGQMDTVTEVMVTMELTTVLRLP